MEAMERMQSMIDAKMETLMETWHVEGLSLGIVKDGQVILEKGYGKRNKTENLDMTEKTVLPIGSATKSFTALSLAMLADEGKVDLDQTVKTYIPWLELYNDELTEHVTVRDLLCHRTGLPRYDAPAVFCTKDDRKEMVCGICSQMHRCVLCCSIPIRWLCWPDIWWKCCQEKHGSSL